MIEVPGPELLAARQRLLDGIMATWRRPAKVSAASRPLDAIVGRYRAAWEKAHAAKAALLAEAAAVKASPGDGYWKAEHAARARYEAALGLAEAFLQVRST